MKFSFKSVKKFLWDYKYIIALLLVLFIIYYHMNVYIQENLENNVTKNSASDKFADPKLFALQVMNKNTFDFNIQVYKLSYNSTSNTNSYTEIVKSTLVPAGKGVILPAGNPNFPSKGFDAKVYLDGGNLGFAVKVSTVDGSAKPIVYTLNYCNKQKAGQFKTVCTPNGPSIGKFKELNDLNFKDARDKGSITISYEASTTTYTITAKENMNSYSIGFIYLPSVTSK